MAMRQHHLSRYSIRSLCPAADATARLGLFHGFDDLDFMLQQRVDHLTKRNTLRGRAFRQVALMSSIGYWAAATICCLPAHLGIEVDRQSHFRLRFVELPALAF